MSIGEFVETRWIRIFGLGLLVWLVPFVLSFSFFWLEIMNSQYYVTLMLGIGMLVAVACAALHLPFTPLDKRWEGIAMGFIWMPMWLGLQCVGLYLLLNIDITSYLQQEAWQAIHIPAITVVGGLLGYARQQQMLAAERRVKVIHGSLQ